MQLKHCCDNRHHPSLLAHQVWTAATFTILNKIFDLAPSYLIGVAVDVVASQENSIIAQIGITNIIGKLAILSLLTLLIWTLESLSSAVDNETEAAIQKSLAMITQNRTTIAIAHRLSTIRHSHCILCDG